MANNKPTIFQKLSYVLGGNSGLTNLRNNVNVYNLKDSEVLFKTKDRAEYERKALELKQQKLLANQWRRAQLDLNNKSLAGLNEVKMMYRDADLMDTFPEIGAALDIVSEEATYIRKHNHNRRTCIRNPFVGVFSNGKISTKTPLHSCFSSETGIINFVKVSTTFANLYRGLLGAFGANILYPSGNSSAYK